MIRIRITASGRVDCRAVLRIELPAGKVWGQLRDFHRFARQEFFHSDLTMNTDSPRQGARLSLTHRFLLFRLRRAGRICIWREGVGFCFSDLSMRGPRHGFPHIFSYHVQPVDPRQCDVEIRVAGLWTATFIPRPVTYLWLRWIMQFTAQRVRNELMIYRFWLLKRQP